MCLRATGKDKRVLTHQMKNEWVAMLGYSNWLAKLCYLSDTGLNHTTFTREGNMAPNAVPFDILV